MYRINFAVGRGPIYPNSILYLFVKLIFESDCIIIFSAVTAGRNRSRGNTPPDSRMDETSEDDFDIQQPLEQQQPRAPSNKPVSFISSL